MGATGATSGNGSNVGGADMGLRPLRIGLDGSAANGSSTTGDWGFKSLTASGNTAVKTGAGQLGRLITGTATGNITMYDGTSTSGEKILDTCALAVGVTEFNIAFATGLFIVLSGAGVATATYR